MRTIFYVDGFNFYYGIRNITKQQPKWLCAYWINIVKFFSYFLDDKDNLVKVKYFTASPLSSSKNSRQSALFKANNILSQEKFEIIRGKYIEKDILCRSCNTHFSKPEEKRTDVNIATHLIGDCALGKVDKIVLVTADSDLIPPIEFIKENYKNIKIKIYFPPNNFSYDLARVNPSRKVVLLKNNFDKFKKSHMQKKVTKLDNSDFAIIPDKWKVNN
ncbi:NYN domain-containing protein [Psychroflexus sp. MBR-150]|jgi:uncharacterized LabA/DUF88 family protein